MRKIEEHEGKKGFNGWWLYLDKVLENIKEMIDIRKFDHTKILI